MLLYYALGGGLGHLTRARAVLHTLGIVDDVIVLASSPFATDIRVTGELRIEDVPEAVRHDARRYRDWLSSLVDRWQPEGAFVDTFPAGLFGELGGNLFSGVPVWHVARRLRWETYREHAGGALPRFAVSYLIEPIDPVHATVLDSCSAEVSWLALEDPPASDPEPGPLPDSFWLVAHSGPPDEVRELIAYARETLAVERSRATVVVATPIDPGPLPEGCIRLDVYPASALFARAQRVITAAGFNAMRQAAPWRHKHLFVPFPRRFDDQFARAAAARRARTRVPCEPET